jgi:hypothetical protein
MIEVLIVKSYAILKRILFLIHLKLDISLKKTFHIIIIIGYIMVEKVYANDLLVIKNFFNFKNKINIKYSINLLFEK